MTEENFNYRTNPMFLRNQFYTHGKYGIPTIPKFNYKYDDLKDIRVIGFDIAKNGKDNHFNRMVHFFLYDYKFENIWKTPDKYIENLKKYRAVLSPDFSMYIEMALPLKIYNTFRNRWCGAYLASKGIPVIPTISFGNEETFDFCFEGIEKGSTVAISTYMVSEHNNHSDQKDFFMKGYNEMLRVIEPENIICYNTPFPEMEGNIIYVDYELSSWMHLNDQFTYNPSAYAKYVCGIEPWPKNCGIIRKTTGYVISEKGTGSAGGGKWKPNKPDDQRLVGKPGDIKEFTRKNGDRYQTKIGPGGKAIKERHNTDHGFPDKHSNPHDHEIGWDPESGIPKFGPPINYPAGAPEFKNFEGIMSMCKKLYTETNSFEEDRFKTISNFKWCMKQGGEIQFEWNNKKYGITHPDGKISVYEYYKPETELVCETADEALEYIIDGQKLREIITQVKVWDRTI